MKNELSQAELNREFYGKPAVVKARFFIQQVINIPKSKDAGQRVMKDAVYVEVKGVSEVAHMVRPAKPDDYSRYRDAYAEFQKEQDDESRHSEIPDCRVEGEIVPIAQEG